jgi:hypothetical protein
MFLTLCLGEEQFMGPSMSVCLSRVSSHCHYNDLGTIAKMTLDTIVAFHTIVAFDIPLIALLTSSPVMWRKEHLWNFSVLQRVHALSSLITIRSYYL